MNNNRNRYKFRIKTGMYTLSNLTIYTIIKYLHHHQYASITKMLYNAIYNHNNLFIETLLKYFINNRTYVISYNCSSDYDDFRNICAIDCLNMIQYMIQLSNAIGYPIDIHTFFEDPFQKMCKYGHIYNAKYIVHLANSLGSPINIHAWHNCVFIFACNHYMLDVAQYIISICPEIYSYHIDDNNRIIPRIKIMKLFTNW